MSGSVNETWNIVKPVGVQECLQRSVIRQILKQYTSITSNDALELEAIGPIWFITNNLSV